MFTTQEVQNATLATGRLMIQANMQELDHWLLRGIVAIFERQTADEQRIESTRVDNGIGFNGMDAKILSSFAKQIMRWEANVKNGRPNMYNRPLSPKQTQIARRKMMKYAGQLMRIVREKQPA